MHDLLNDCPPTFPQHKEEVYTLKGLLNNNDKTYSLPLVVNVASLNNYGRYLKSILAKNSILLLVDTRQLDSVLAECHRSQDGRHHHIHRHRLTLTQGKKSAKGSGIFLDMKKLSKSLASLTAMNPTTPPPDDDTNLNDGGEDDDAYHQRLLVKNLNEKRSTSVPLCRVPILNRSFFEFLNENDRSSEPYHRIGDMTIVEYDDNEPEKRRDKWPRAFFLRSCCPAFTQKSSCQPNDKNSNSGVSSDSCYGSSSDLDSHKSPIILNDEVQILQPGQILFVLSDSYAIRTRILEPEVIPQQQQQQQLTPPPGSPSSPRITATTWLKAKLLPSKKRRHSLTREIYANENSPRTCIPNKPELYLKCRTQYNDIVYISVHESGLFSPLNCQTNLTKSDTDLSPDDIIGVFQVKDLLSNFRFPMSIRLLTGSVSFINPYLPAFVNPHETPTKFRLLMPYTEQVVFACVLNLPTSKSQKSAFPLIVLPLPMNADMDLQPCLNMKDISGNNQFHRLMENCFQLIEQYQKEISLIHFPLQLTNNRSARKQTLHPKRSHSECYFESSDDPSNYKIRHSCDQLDSIHKNSPTALKQKFSAKNNRKPVKRYSEPFAKIQKRRSRDEISSDDERYNDVDKIYDYIRSGDLTIDVQKIQEKAEVFHGTASPLAKGPDRQMSATTGSPAKMMTHRFPGNTDQDLDFHSCKNDGNVDEDQAHELYLASKQDPKPITKMKRITKR